MSVVSRLRARRAKSKSGLSCVELYIDYEDGGPIEPLVKIVPTQVPNLVMDLSLALQGEALARSAPPPSKDLVAGEVIETKTA